MKQKLMQREERRAKEEIEKVNCRISVFEIEKDRNADFISRLENLIARKGVNRRCTTNG